MLGEETPAKRGEETERRGWAAFDWRYWREPHDGIAAALYALATISLAIVGATAFLLIVRTFLPVWSSDKLETDDLRNLLIAIGAIIAAPFAIWRIIISHWSAQAAQEQARISRENLYTSLFAKAVEQLGAMREIKETHALPDNSDPYGKKFEAVTRTMPNTEVRLGAIYALERIAQDSERDHWPIMETLCAYIRNNSTSPKEVPLSILGTEWGGTRHSNMERVLEIVSPPSADVQAAITVIARRPSSNKKGESRLRKDRSNAGKLDLRGVNLQGALLDHCDFDSALLDGAYLDGASMNNARLTSASLYSAYLRGTALAGADMTKIDLSNAHLDGALLAHAQLQNGILSNASLSLACIDDANLNDAELGQAYLRGAHLHRASLDNAKLRNASLNDAILTNASLVCAFMPDTNLDNANLVDTNLNGAILCNASFENARLNNAQFIESNLIGANLSLAFAPMASFERAQLIGARLTGTQLQGASFRSANMESAYIYQTQLQHASFRGANLSAAKICSN